MTAAGNNSGSKRPICRTAPGALNAPGAFVMYSLILLADQNSNCNPARR